MPLETSPDAVPVLDFHNDKTSRSVHGLHAFVAKFPPQLATRATELVARYSADMQGVLSAIGRILEPGGHAVLVVCPSHLRRIPIAWHEAFSSFARQMPAEGRLFQVALIPRTLDDSRRILPFRNAGARLAGRMRTEYVLVLRNGGG